MKTKSTDSRKTRVFQKTFAKLRLFYRFINRQRRKELHYIATLIYRAKGALKERFGEPDQIDINLFRFLIAASSAVNRKLSAESTAWEFNESTPSSQRLKRICWTNFLKVKASQELSASARP